MGSDRARSSYDPAQQYRAVIRQQGRVTLDADENEAWLIANEQRRAAVCDIIGVTGTPDDDGYLITPVAGFGFTIKPGTIYVGGERVEIGADPNGSPYTYDHQPDWLNPPAAAKPSLELVYLSLREQEISAVEDHDLKDVALGGPDTAQRLRLMQRVERLDVTQATCAGALSEAEKQWLASGLRYDPLSAQLVSLAALKVGFDNLSGKDNVCEPIAQGGYLGADNQLIRVQISSPNDFLWGYDDASFLYRVSAVSLDGKTLTLAERPLDAFHEPRSGQHVEVLRATARLANGEYVAYACDTTNPPPATGHLVTKLARAYHRDDKAIVLETALSGDLDPKQTPMLFVRVWEEQKTIAAGNPVSLGTTGVNVTLSAKGAFHAGDYWTIAVRPSTPTQVYPERLQVAPQPPDGPREWVCPLAVIAWKNDISGTATDCRDPFDDLVDLTKRKAVNTGGCCTVNVAPADLRDDVTLQTIADRYRHRANVTICLTPGVYALPEPLRLTIEHSGLTIESCDDGADLRAATGAEAKFLDGLIVLDRANSVTLRGLRFTLPQVPFVAAGGKLAAPPAVRKNVPQTLLDDLFVSIGVRAIHCALLAIDDCLFRFTVTERKSVLGIGVFAQSECWGLRVSRTRFLHEEDVLRSVAEQPFRMLIGYALAPALTAAPPRRPGGAAPGLPPTNAPQAKGPDFIVLRALLQDARFEHNVFMGISVAALILADVGVVAFEGNTVRAALGGFWLIAQNATGEANSLTELAVPERDVATARQLLDSIGHVFTEPAVLLGTVLVRTYPLPATVDAQHLAGKPAQGTSPRGAMLPPIQAQPVDAGQKAGFSLKPLQDYLRTVVSFYTGPLTRSKRAAKAPAADAAAAQDVVVTRDVYRSATSLVSTLQQVQRDLSRFELAAFGKRPRHMFFPAALRFVGNDVDAVVHGVASSAALIVWGDRADVEASLVLDGNRFRNAAPLVATAAGLFLERCVVTGNVIVNEAKLNAAQMRRQGAAPALISLELYVQPETPWDNPTIAVAAVTITGNLFRGRTILPQRTLDPQPDPPLDSWDFFNTMI